MGTPLDYIYEHELQVQPSFRGDLGISGQSGYRGELLIKAGSKEILKHAIIIADKETALLFAGELDDFDNFEALYSSYKTLFNSTSIVTFSNSLKTLTAC